MMIPDGNLRTDEVISQSAHFMYHHSQMRRTLSIFLVLLFSLAPLAASLDTGSDANEDASVPACCRRHGAHHCLMTMQTAAMLAALNAGKVIATGPSTCPSFPASLPATVSTPHALAGQAVSLPALLAQFHSPATSSAATRISQFRTRSDRGPPQPVLA